MMRLNDNRQKPLQEDRHITVNDFTKLLIFLSSVTVKLLNDSELL